MPLFVQNICVPTYVWTQGRKMEPTWMREARGGDDLPRLLVVRVSDSHDQTASMSLSLCRLHTCTITGGKL
jgi:hypothetical protein